MAIQKISFAQKAFITLDGKLLLVRKSKDDPNHPGKWEVPGGRMIFGEQVDTHIYREVREEVGIEIIPGAPFYVWQWRMVGGCNEEQPKDIQVVAVARFCQPVTTELSVAGRTGDDYLDEMAWVPFNEINKYKLIPNMLPVFDTFLAQVQNVKTGL